MRIRCVGQFPSSGSEDPYFTSYCAFDSSVRTQYPYSSPSGKWGKGSSDEMCIDFLWYYPRIPGVIRCPLASAAQTVLTLPNEDAGWVPMSSRRVDLTFRLGSGSPVSVPNGQRCIASSTDTLLYCSWDGALFRGNMIRWDGVNSAGCSADYTGNAGFSKESVENGGTLNGVQISCAVPSTPAGRATGIESLSGPDDLGRVFGTAAAVGPVTFTGFLADTICIGIINSVDGTNVTTDAPAHTVDCMLLQYCIDSGFTIMEEVDGNYKAKYQLDAHGVTLAVAALQELGVQGVVNNVNFTVTGIPGAAATYSNAATYNGQPLGVVLATSAVVAGTPGVEIITEGDMGDRVAGDDAVKEFEVVGGIVIGLVAVAAIVVVFVFERKGQSADARGNSKGANDTGGFGL